MTERPDEDQPARADQPRGDRRQATRSGLEAVFGLVLIVGLILLPARLLAAHRPHRPSWLSFDPLPGWLHLLLGPGKLVIIVILAVLVAITESHHRRRDDPPDDPPAR